MALLAGRGSWRSTGKRGRSAGGARTVTIVTDQDALAGPVDDDRDDDGAAVTALVDACRLFAAHVGLLADHLRAVRLSTGDVQRIREALHRVHTAAGLAAVLTIGVRHRAREGQCPHYNALTDAEWAPLAEGVIADDRSAVYGCGLQKGHTGAHVTHAQSVADRDREAWLHVWLRWDDHTRELVVLPPCPVVDHSADPEDEDEPCLLFEGHVGAHDFDF